MLGRWRRSRCIHRSHRLRLRCLREITYQSECGKHNTWECNPVRADQQDACPCWQRFARQDTRKD